MLQFFTQWKQTQNFLMVREYYQNYIKSNDGTSIFKKKTFFLSFIPFLFPKSSFSWNVFAWKPLMACRGNKERENSSIEKKESQSQKERRGRSDKKFIVWSRVSPPKNVYYSFGFRKLWALISLFILRNRSFSRNYHLIGLPLFSVFQARTLS